jgi:hypothetical protein
MVKESIARFYDEPRDLSAIVILRVTTGLCLAAHYLMMLPIVPKAWGPNGIAGTDYYRTFADALAPARPNTLGLQWLAAIDSIVAIWLLYALLIATALAFSVGLFTRWSGVLALVLHSLFHARMEFVFWGWGELIKPFMLYAIIAPQVLQYSFDSKLRTGRWTPAHADVMTGAAWPLRLIQMHVVTVYFVVAWTRLDDPNWINGSMLYGILTDPLFGRIDSDWRALMPLLKFTGYLAWFIELAAPFALWWRKTRFQWVVLLALMHFGLEALTMVGYWDFLMIGALTAFVDFGRRRRAITT